MDEVLWLGTKTQWGKIAMIRTFNAGTPVAERYYWMMDEDGDVAMMPASTVEPAQRTYKERRLRV